MRLAASPEDLPKSSSTKTPPLLYTRYGGSNGDSDNQLRLKEGRTLTELLLLRMSILV